MFLLELFNIGYGDAHYIDELANIIEDEGLADDMRDPLEKLTLEEIDANFIISLLFNRINYLVFTKIKHRLNTDTIEEITDEEKKALLNLCHERIDNFSPYINCLDSHFNNELGNILLRGRSFSQITDDVLDLLISNYREGLYS